MCVQAYDSQTSGDRVLDLGDGPGGLGRMRTRTLNQDNHEWMPQVQVFEISPHVAEIAVSW